MIYESVVDKYGRKFHVNKNTQYFGEGVYKFYCKAVDGKTYSYVGYSSDVAARINGHLRNTGVWDKLRYLACKGKSHSVNCTHALSAVWACPSFFNEWYFDRINCTGVDEVYLMEGKTLDECMDKGEIMLNIMTPPGSSKWLDLSLQKLSREMLKYHEYNWKHEKNEEYDISHHMSLSEIK